MSRILLISVVLSIMIVVCVAYPNEQKVFIFEQANHRGDAFSVGIKQCVNLNDWSERVSSVNTNNGCVKLYSRKSCKGDFVQLLPGSDHHHDLSQLGFDKVAHSIGVC